MNTRNVFLMNLLLAVLWAALHADLSVTTFIIGFLFGFLLLSVAHRGYGATVVGVAGFILFLIRAIIVSSIQVAGYVLAPTLRLDQGIIEIPLEARSDLEIAILARDAASREARERQDAITRSILSAPPTSSDSFPMHCFSDKVFGTIYTDCY